MAQCDTHSGGKDGHPAVKEKRQNPGPSGALILVPGIFLSSGGSPGPAVLTRAFFPQSTANALRHSPQKKPLHRRPSLRRSERQRDVQAQMGRTLGTGPEGTVGCVRFDANAGSS